MQLFTLSNFI